MPRSWLLLGLVLCGCGRLEYARVGVVDGGDAGETADGDAPRDGGEVADGARDSGPPPGDYYIAPTGDDASPGTLARPFRTWSHAVAQLGPGQSLVALDGTYGLASETGYLFLDCRAGSTACGGAPCPSGTSTAPITVRAERERQAILRYEPTSTTRSAIAVVGCTDWIIEGLTAISGDDATLVADSTVGVGGSDRVTLRRLLVSGHNRYLNSKPVAVSGSSNVLVEDCEIYDFSRIGIDVWMASDVVVRRCYLHGRGALDLPGGYVGGAPWAEVGIGFGNSARGWAENNVIEGDFDMGIEITAGEPVPTIVGVGDDHHALGNIIVPTASPSRAFHVYSNCDPGPTCIADEDVVSRIELLHNVVVGNGHTALLDRGVEGLTVRNFSAHGAALRIEVPSNNDGLRMPSAFLDNVLITGANDGISVADHATWAADHVNAFVTGVPFAPPGDPGFTFPTTLDPALGGCLVYVPGSSPMSGVGARGEDIGADVVFRYRDGALTSERLWDPATGRFPCGAVVPGINDAAMFPDSSCSTVHTRVHVGTGGCPLP